MTKAERWQLACWVNPQRSPTSLIHPHSPPRKVRYNRISRLDLENEGKTYPAEYFNTLLSPKMTYNVDGT